MKLPPWAWTLWRRLESVAPDALALRLMYRRKLGRLLRLRHPQAFTEKVQWMKLHYRPPTLATLADKFTVRQYVADRIGPSCLNELLGVWDRPEDIPFDALPDRYALKVTSTSHAQLVQHRPGIARPGAGADKAGRVVEAGRLPRLARVGVQALPAARSSPRSISTKGPAKARSTTKSSASTATPGSSKRPSAGTRTCRSRSST